MSCHNIGEGLNTVTKKIIELYDEGKIEFGDVKSLLHTIKQAVYPKINAKVELSL